MKPDIEKKVERNQTPKRKRFEVEKLEERIAPGALVGHIGSGGTHVHGVLTPSGNLNLHGHV